MSLAIKTAIKAALAADPTFTAIIPDGRVFADVNELSRKKTPGAFDANSAIQCSLLIKQETTSPFGPHDHTGRLFIPLIFYDHEDSGYTDIETAALRAYQLFHEAYHPLTGQPVFQMTRVDHLADQEDPAITNAITVISRYLLYIATPSS